MVPHHGWQAQAHVAPATVAKVPLYPGEKVLYFARPDQTMTRILYFVYGTLFLILIFGLYFLYLGIFFDTADSHVWVITSHRVFTVNNAGKVMTQIGVHEIQRVVNRVGAGRNDLNVHSANDLIMFRSAEKHDARIVGPILENLRNPAFVQQAPPVRFDP
jgi:hypothetical protein